MKWLTLVLVILSTTAVVAVLGFSAFSVIMGIIGGPIASFAIAGYLQSISRDDPGDRYEHIR